MSIDRYGSHKLLAHEDKGTVGIEGNEIKPRYMMLILRRSNMVKEANINKQVPVATTLA